MSRKYGFTLIELLIVIVIIGILAVISIPNFISMVSRAKDASVKGNMHIVQVTLESFSTLTEGYYPSRLDITINQVRQSLNYGTVPTGDYTKSIAGIDPGITPSSPCLLPNNFKNPIRPPNFSFSSTSSRPSWNSNSAGCVFVKETGVSGSVAMGFVIYGMGTKNILADTLIHGK